MCLPFLCGGHEDHGSTAHNDTRQHHQPSDHVDAAYPPYDPIAVVPSPLKQANNHRYVGRKNGGAGGNAVAQGRRAADAVNKNGESTGAPVMYISDSDAPAPVGRGRKGAAEKLIAASSPARQAAGQMETKMAVPTTTTPQAPERREHVAPVQQVARRDDDDYSPPPAPAPAPAERASRDSPSSVNRWK